MADQIRSLSKMQPSTQLAALSPEYAEHLTVELMKLAVLMGEQVSEERLALTLAEIADIAPRDLEKGLALCRREGKWFPKPGEIREMVMRANPLAGMKFFDPKGIR